jgi:hypothetical protein
VRPHRKHLGLGVEHRGARCIKLWPMAFKKADANVKAEFDAEADAEAEAASSCLSWFNFRFLLARVGSSSSPPPRLFFRLWA